MPRRTKHQQTLVVIGNGMVGWKLCQRLVELGANEEIKIVVFGEEPRPAYDRAHLTNLFSGASEEELTLAPAEWYADNGIDLYLGDPVIAVDRTRSLVISASGNQIAYNRLVFATGSYPFVPSVEGVDLPGIFVYRTVDNFYDIKDYSEGVKRAAVLGGGLLGLEAAKALLDLGLEVHVIELGLGLMHRQIDKQGASILRDEIEKLGVKVHVQKELVRILSGEPRTRKTHYRTAPVLLREDPPKKDAESPEPASLLLQFADGEELGVDMLVIAAGIRPRSELAQDCGLVCGLNGGIQVNERLETSDVQIYAIGECATFQGTSYGLVLPGYQMVELVVDNLFGGSAMFEGSAEDVKLNVPGLTVAALGEYSETDEYDNPKPLTSALRYTAGGVYRKLVTRHGRLIGAVTVGDWENLEQIREALRSPRATSWWDMRRFRHTGNLWPKSES